MEQVESVLAEARAAGLEVRAETGRLVVRGQRVHEPLARQVLEQKPVVLAFLAQEDADIAWRVAAMRPQITVKGPIPILRARDKPHRAGCCVSCDVPLPENTRYRCSLCARAAWFVLHEVREDVRPENE